MPPRTKKSVASPAKSAPAPAAAPASAGRGGKRKAAAEVVEAPQKRGKKAAAPVVEEPVVVEPVKSAAKKGKKAAAVASPKKAAVKPVAESKSTAVVARSTGRKAAVVESEESDEQDDDDDEDSENSDNFDDIIIFDDSDDEEDDDEFSIDPALAESIEASQDRLNAVDDTIAAESEKIAQKYYSQKTSDFKRRDDLIAEIPRFWKHLMINHPRLAPLWTEVDEDILNFLERLECVEFFGPAKKEEKKPAAKATGKKGKKSAAAEEVKESSSSSSASGVSGFRVKMIFSAANPYFKQREIVKTFEINRVEGFIDISVDPAPIDWSDEHFDSHYPDSFFVGWTSPDVEDEEEQHRNDEVDVAIGRILLEEIYRNPVQAAQELESDYDEEDDSDEDEEDSFDSEDYDDEEDSEDSDDSQTAYLIEEYDSEDDSDDQFDDDEDSNVSDDLIDPEHFVGSEDEDEEPEFSDN